MLSERLRFRDVRSTSTFRLTLLLGSAFLVGIVAMLGLIYLLTTWELTTRSDQILYEKAQSLLATPADRLPDRIRAEIGSGSQGFSYFALLDREGQGVVGNVAGVPGMKPDKPFNIPRRPGVHGPLRMLAVRTPSGEMIVLGRDISQIHSLRRRITMILAVSGVAGVLGVFAAAVLLSVRPLRRVRDLQEASQAIAAGHLDTRMPIAGRHDELDQFAATLNQMIEEVGRVIAQVKTATDAIAHDLRTPLTHVRAYLHRAANGPDLPPDSARLVGQAIDDLDDVLARFTALLRISELEASARRSGRGEVDLSALVEEVADLYAPLAEESGISLTWRADEGLRVDADGKLLFEAVSNLVDNAIKFSSTSVSLRAAQIDGRPALEVADDGPGIAEDQRDAVLRRFHRAPDAAEIPGSGLGLSVVSAILHVHGFRLELGDARPGLIARIRM